ncbi:large ribosomal subunit protein mL53 [Pseudophryne corroboree]|uniref:large ribosomal subunit protein mL53 n=1 Tax=Pseudophryne corroboree TaxID=495146 RepID=UPI00308139C9
MSLSIYHIYYNSRDALPQDVRFQGAEDCGICSPHSDWTLRRCVNIMAAAKGTQLVLKSVKAIAVRMCPFESNVRATREFLEAINTKKIRSSNTNCEITVDVRHDKSEPLVDILFVDGERLVFKSSNVTCKEMVSKFSAVCAWKDLQAKDSVKK